MVFRYGGCLSGLRVIGVCYRESLFPGRAPRVEFFFPDLRSVWGFGSVSVFRFGFGSVSGLGRDWFAAARFRNRGAGTFQTSPTACCI